MKIRMLGKSGDSSQTVVLEEGKKIVEEKLKQGCLVIDETNPGTKRMLQNALGLTENSSVTVFPHIEGG